MTSNPKKELAGVLCVFQTPFHDDESIDWETLEKELNWLLESGVNGVVMALASELLRLSGQERDEMAQFVCRIIADRAVKVISVGAESTHAAERNARLAEEAGATAVMAIPPLSVSVAVDETRAYYERLLRATTLPVIIQDASGYVGQPISLDLQAELVNEYGAERVQFKPEASPIGPRLTALREATGGRARIFEGSGGAALFDSHRRGVRGTMPGADLIKGLVALWKALETGDEERARRLSFPICSMVSHISSLDGFVTVEKYLLVRQGVFRNTVVRGPVAYRLDEETRGEIDRLFDIIMGIVGESA